MKKFSLLLLFVGLHAFAQKELPNLQLPNLDGKTVSLKQIFRKRQIIHIFILATWCTPCIQELDEMNDLKEAWQKEVNFEIVAVSTDDSRTQNA
jgi:peroxiredoxin